MKIEGAVSPVFFCSIFINVIFVLLVGYKFYLRLSGSHDQNTIGTPYWQDKVAYFEILNKQQKGGGIFLVGDSMFDRLDIGAAWPGSNVRNRGIGYDNIHSLSSRLERTVLSGAPRKVILFVGGNDLSKSDDVEKIIANTERIIQRIMNKDIKVLFISLLPRGEQYLCSHRSTASINDDVLYFNRKIKKKCLAEGADFIDITGYFVNDNFFLDRKFTSDEIHLNAQGIVLLAALLKPYIVQ